MIQHLYFDTDGCLQVRGQNGFSTHIRHPEGLLKSGHSFEGGHLLAGAFTIEVEGNTIEIGVDFLRLTEPWKIQRWTVGADGMCGQPRDLVLAVERPIGPGYLISPCLIEALQKRSNDLEIYSVLRMLCGREAAENYLKSYIATNRPDVGAPCRLVIIFNHNFSRNCRALYDFYSDRFPDIDFVLPCVAPKHPNYYSYPFGSFQFHGLIAGYLQDRLRTASSTVQTYVFIQDDVLLHPRITGRSIADLLEDEYAAWFPFDYRYKLDWNEWPWAERVRNAFGKQRDHQTGSGFEGLLSVVSAQDLRHGVSDCFALRASIAPEFAYRLSPMVAANLFAEVAIPTALFNTVSSAGLKMLIQPGTLLWQEQRSLVTDPQFIKLFLSSEAAFLHPVKIASSGSVTLQLLRDAMKEQV